MNLSLYERLGGADRLSALVSAVVDRTASDPVLAPRLRGADLRRLREQCVHLLSAGFGGPPTYEGVDLRPLRAGIGEREFAALAADVVGVLQAHEVAPRDIDTVVGALQSLRAGR